MTEPESPLHPERWLPRTDDEEICGDSRAEVGDPNVCGLVKGHPCYHYDPKLEAHWALNWRELRKDWPKEDKEDLKLD